MPTDAFSIRVLAATDQTAGSSRSCEIQVGSFVERFAIHPTDAERMTALWLDGLRCLVTGEPAVGLPTANNMTWVLYRIGTEVRVHQMLMMPDVGPTLAPGGRVVGIPAYDDGVEEGEPVSEWRTTVDAIVAFLESGPPT